MTDIEVMQAFFDTTVMGYCLNWPVDVERMVHAIRDLRFLHANPDSDPEEIARSWRQLAAAAGVDFMGSVLKDRGEWQPLAYAHASERKPFREHDDYTVLWEQPAGCVVATVREEHSTIIGVDFVVRPAC